MGVSPLIGTILFDIGRVRGMLPAKMGHSCYLLVAFFFDDSQERTCVRGPHGI